MRNVCWPAWLSAIALVAFVLTTAGCQSAEPLVPREVYQQVNDDGREWTYDTAWQNIRKLNADLEAGELSAISTQSLFIVSQMERLETGKATDLRHRWARQTVLEMSLQRDQGSSELLRQLIRDKALQLQAAFDDGDFSSAKKRALEVSLLVADLESAP